VPSTDLRATVDAVWRMEAAKIVATLTRSVGDVGLAEDLAQEALADALTQWPSTGLPRNPGAWLTTVATQGDRSVAAAGPARRAVRRDGPRAGNRTHPA
jgi:predicted RNA polymerase sigma factor